MKKMPLGPLMLDIDGLSLTAEDREILEHPLVGGIILFSRNYENPAQVAALIKDIHASRSPRLIVAVDQEGGRVQRFREGFTRLPPLGKIGELYAADSEKAKQLAYQHAWLMAQEQRAVGVDISFAPIVDLHPGVSEIIGDRAFSGDITTVTELNRAYIKGMHDAGMAATAKHFPGHGSVAEDSHIAMPVDKREWSEIESYDLKPFVNLNNEYDAVMLAHVIYSAVDTLPAGFSGKWVKDILRKDMGFNGVAFSDDLSMEGAVAIGSYADRADAAWQAGCDMALVCNNRAGAIEVIDAHGSYRNKEAETRLEAFLQKCQPLANNSIENSSGSSSRLTELEKMPDYTLARTQVTALLA